MSGKKGVNIESQVNRLSAAYSTLSVSMYEFGCFHHYSYGLESKRRRKYSKLYFKQ